jgi:hypothetical protein
MFRGDRRALLLLRSRRGNCLGTAFLCRKRIPGPTVVAKGPREDHVMPVARLPSSRIAKSCLCIFTCMLCASAANADQDIDFVYQVCLSGMRTQPQVPQTESNAFCACATERVRKSITPQQRSAIREAQRRITARQSIPPNMFEPSGLRALIEKSQDYCIDSRWPQRPKISAEDHQRYSTRANRSVEEFDALLELRCKNVHDSSGRSSCALATAKEWLSKKSAQYEDIPSNYITGNDLAISALKNASQPD